jgi:hypothetical protein
MVVGFITFPDDESHINRHSNSSIQRGNDFGQPITTIAANAKKGEGITSWRAFPRRDHPARRAAPAVRKVEVRGDLEQRPEHKAAVFHIVVRNGQALAVNDRIAKQHDVEVERARPPAFGFAHPTLLQLDALSVIEQRSGPGWFPARRRR